MKAIPFDSLSLAAVVQELQSLRGGRLQRAVQPSPHTLVLGIYAQGKERGLLLSCSTEFPRAHLTRERPASTGIPPELAAAIRRELDGARLVRVQQAGFDRILRLVFATEAGEFDLVAELTGRHANLILVQPDGKVVASAHGVARKQSIRPVFPGARYEPPPFPPRKPIFEAESWEDFEDSEGASPFLKSLVKAEVGNRDFPAMRTALGRLGESVRTGRFRPVVAPGYGVYPVSVAALGYPEVPVDSFSDALEDSFRKREEEHEREALRRRLLAPIRRVLLAREVAIQDLEQAADAGRNARSVQERAELILAFANTIEPGQEVLETTDYEGRPQRIPLDPELSPLENAQRLFDRAKHAKSRAGFVVEQLRRLQEDRIAALGAVRRIEDAADIDTLREEEARARARNWLRQAGAAGAKPKEERPFEGHRVRELAGPGGVRVLYGENATSNDYLTQKVARPNDFWLHVRGATSAHVVISTQNRPERIGRETLEFAAQVAVANSPSKHSRYVSVDYTLKKYVRKPRGAPAGSVTYTHEKTLSVEKSR